MTISSIKDPAVLLARQRLSQLGTDPPTSYLVEGHKMIGQALSSPAEVETIFLRAPARSDEDGRVQAAARERGVPCHLVNRGVFVRIHDLGYETSVSSLAVVTRRPLDSVPLPQDDRYCLLVGERIQDPKNIGSLIRTADAWAGTAVALTLDSADPYSRGSVRPSTGSILRVPLVQVAQLSSFVEKLKASSVRVIGTSAQATSPCWKTDLTGPCAILVGNESVGLSSEAKALCDKWTTIPMLGGAHSFNVAVAAGIVLYERTRQVLSAGMTNHQS